MVSRGGRVQSAEGALGGREAEGQIQGAECGVQGQGAECRVQGPRDGAPTSLGKFQRWSEQFTGLLGHESSDLERRQYSKGVRGGLADLDAEFASALQFGDIEDPASNVSRLLAENRHFRMHEELGTGPGFY